MWVDVFLPMCTAGWLSGVDRSGDGKKPYNSEGPEILNLNLAFQDVLKLYL